MAITEARPPHKNKSTLRVAGGEIDRFSKSAEVEVSSSQLLEAMWFTPTLWDYEGVRYTRRFIDVPGSGVRWPDGTSMTYLEEIAVAETRHRRDEFLAGSDINKAAFDQARAIVNKAMEARGKTRRRQSKLERASLDLYNAAVRTWQERVISEEGQQYDTTLNTFADAVKRNTKQDPKQMFQGAAKAFGKFFLKQKGAAAIDAMMGGIPIATAISSASSVVNIYHNLRYHVPRIIGTKQSPIFYAGKWVNVKYSEGEFDSACISVEKALRRKPLYVIPLPDGSKYEVEFAYRDLFCTREGRDAFLEAIYLLQPTQERARMYLGAVFLQQARSIVPKWIWEQYGLPKSEFPQLP